MVRVSIIIPVYNAEKTVERCVGSVLNQEYRDLEVIVVDDGSKDHTPEILDAMAEKDERLRVMHVENGGVSKARNLGLSIMQGTYVQFLDADDYIPMESTKLLVRSMEESGSDLVIADFYRVVGENVARKGSIRSDSLLTLQEFASLMMESPSDFYYGVLWNKLYKAEIFNTLRYADGKRYEDMFLLPYLIERCQKIACMGYQGYRHAQRAGSIMSQGDPRNYLDRSEYLLDWTACFAAKGDTLRAEGLLNDAIENLAEKDRFDLSTPAQQQRYRTACRACADAYRDLANRTGQRSMLLRAALLRLGLPAYRAFLKHKA